MSFVRQLKCTHVFRILVSNINRPHACVPNPAATEKQIEQEDQHAHPHLSSIHAHGHMLAPLENTPPWLFLWMTGYQRIA